MEENALLTGRTRLADEALARSAVYRLLSSVFTYPVPETVGRLRDEDLPFATAVAEALPQQVRGELERAAFELSRATPEEIEIAYRGTFSHVHSADCPLYETDFTSREIWRQSQELADLAGFYCAFEIEVEGERPDHISVELEFMHLLAYKEAWAVVQGDREGEEVCRAAQERFLADHLLKWAPGLALRVETVAGTGPYAAAGRLASAFLRAETERIGAAAEEQPEPVDHKNAIQDIGEIQEAGDCEVGS